MRDLDISVARVGVMNKIDESARVGIPRIALEATRMSEFARGSTSLCMF
jgi:hypothetical protein